MIVVVASKVVVASMVVVGGAVVCTVVVVAIPVVVPSVVVVITVLSPHNYPSEYYCIYYLNCSHCIYSYGRVYRHVISLQEEHNYYRHTSN